MPAPRAGGRLAPRLTIRRTILLGCMALTVLTGLLGLVADRAEHRLAAMTLAVYDRALMGTSYLRSAQVGFAEAAGRGGSAPVDARGAGADGAEIASDLDVAVDRAMSAGGRSAAIALRRDLLAWKPGRARGENSAGRLQREFEDVVERFADDGFHIRRATASALDAELRTNEALLIGSLLAAVVITLVLSRAIVPPVRRAVLVAQEIAAGRLGNVIPLAGHGETADLLRALSTMQTSIGDAMAEIRRLMEAQASSHATEIASHHHRMEAALDNMAQGLCLFDAEGRLAVVNRRFGEMFGAIAPGAPGVEVARAAGAHPADRVDPRTPPPSGSWDTPDGRSITMSSQPITGGGWVLTYDDVSEQRAIERRLIHLARHDSLTGLPNRVFYTDHVGHLLARLRPHRRLAVVSLDIDRFKLINDTIGHRAGDELLCEVAARLSGTVREDDLVVRLGADEFVVVFEVGSIVDATDFADRVLRMMSEPFPIAGQPTRIGASLGVATAEGSEATPEMLLKRGDMARRRAKSDGGSLWRIFEPAMDLAARLRRELEFDLRAAVALGQFELHYQPLLRVGGGISGFEALLRWNHPVRGPIGPATFIPIAEESGTIVEIGRWALLRAARDVAGMPDGLKVAVNVSPVQFLCGTVVDDVTAALTASGLPPGRLEIEITESVLIGDDSSVLRTLDAVRGLGVRIAMDDFGTGYSALGYLRRFPFDKIKIDRSFVTGLSDRDDSLAIVRAVIGLGRSLRIHVNAEGVETDQQRSLLEREGCDELQGYLIGRPVPLAQLEPVLALHGIARRNGRILAA